MTQLNVIKLMYTYLSWHLPGSNTAMIKGIHTNELVIVRYTITK